LFHGKDAACTGVNIKLGLACDAGEQLTHRSRILKRFSLAENQ
jgi:hypothetical protein